MEANELRIGNWVEHNSEWFYRGEDVYQFQWSERDWYAVGESTLYLENVGPISLTEEWLLKLGFKNKHTNIFTKQIMISECTAQEKLKLEGWAGNIFLINENQFASNGCKHVHELQNLFFSLCGKELDIV